MENYINKKLGELPIHQLLQRLSLSDFLWSYDADSLYPSAMSDPKSSYPRIETGYAFTPEKNDEIVKKFNNKNFSQGSAILKIKKYCPTKLIVQHIPNKERVKKMDIICMRIGYVVDTLTSVVIQEKVKIEGKTTEISDGFIYRENFKVSLFEKVIDKKFELRQ